jgi:hypothetical protein
MYSQLIHFLSHSIHLLLLLISDRPSLRLCLPLVPFPFLLFCSLKNRQRQPSPYNTRTHISCQHPTDVPIIVSLFLVVIV